MNNDVKTWVTTWFLTHTTATVDEITRSTGASYFDNGWMDSLKFITFIMDVEEHFFITFNNDEFQDRSFSTIDGLITIITQKITDHKKRESSYDTLL